MEIASIPKALKLSLNVRTVIYSYLETDKLFKILDNLSKRHEHVIKDLFSDRFYVICITDALVDNYNGDTIVPSFRKMAEKCW